MDPLIRQVSAPKKHSRQKLRGATLPRRTTSVENASIPAVSQCRRQSCRVVQPRQASNA